MIADPTPFVNTPMIADPAPLSARVSPYAIAGFNTIYPAHFGDRRSSTICQHVSAPL
jgi:hypothetical protein